jgi:hypothetical protein
MHLTRTVAPVVLVVLAGFNLARGADQVLVPGDPPLTQANVDLYQQMWEWYCDIRLTAPERGLLADAFTTLWRKRQKTGNQQALDSPPRTGKRVAGSARPERRRTGTPAGPETSRVDQQHAPIQG